MKPNKKRQLGAITSPATQLHLLWKTCGCKSSSGQDFFLGRTRSWRKNQALKRTWAATQPWDSLGIPKQRVIHDPKCEHHFWLVLIPINMLHIHIRTYLSMQIHKFIHIYIYIVWTVESLFRICCLVNYSKSCVAVSSVSRKHGWELRSFLCCVGVLSQTLRLAESPLKYNGNYLYCNPI